VKGGGGGSFSSIPAGGENLISYDSTGHFVFSVFLHNRHGRTSIGEEDEEFPFILPRFDSDLPVLNYRPEREKTRARFISKELEHIVHWHGHLFFYFFFSLASLEKRHWLFLSVVGLCDLPDTYTRYIDSPNSPTDVSSVSLLNLLLDRVWFRSDFYSSLPSFDVFLFCLS
jgi:hypothetical protein